MSLNGVYAKVYLCVHFFVVSDIFARRKELWLSAQSSFRSSHERTFLRFNIHAISAEDPGIRVSVYGFILQIALDEMCVNVHGITFGSIITVRGENEKHTAEAVRSRDRKVSIAKDSMKGGIIPAAFRIVQAVILFKTTGKNWLK